MEQLLDPKRRPPRARPGEWIHLGEAGPGHYKAENRPCVVTAVDPAFASCPPNSEDPQLLTGARVEGMGDRQSLR
jgi:RecB family exonuclease